MKYFGWFLTFTVMGIIVVFNTDYHNDLAQVEEIVIHKERIIPRYVKAKRPVVNNERKIASVEHSRSLEELSKCLEVECVDFPGRDAREYELAVYYAIAEKIAELSDKWTEDHIDFNEKLPFIYQYLEYPDGFVQEAALDMLAKTEPANESYDALRNVASFTADPVIFEMCCDEFLKYTEFALDDIKNFIYMTIESGAGNISLTAAHQLIRFASIEDLENLQQLQKQYDENTELYKIIGSTIERLE